MGDKIRPEQMEVVTGTANNNVVTTQGWTEDRIHWTRVTGATNYIKAKTAADTLHLNDEESTSFTTADLQIFRNDTPDANLWAANTTAAADANLNLIRSRGTIASPAAVQDNDYIGNINFIAASSASNFNNGAEILARIDGSVSAGVLPTELVFKVNAGAGSATEKMILGKTGILKIDEISEFTGSAGVTIENFVVEDNSITNTQMSLVASTGSIALDAANTISLQSLNGYIINASQYSTCNFRIGSANKSHLFFCNMSEDRVGIGTSSPSVELDVVGSGRFSTQCRAGAVVLSGSEITGALVSGGDLELRSTSHATKGDVFINDGSDFVFTAGASNAQFKVEADIDATIQLGRAKLGSPTTDIMYLSHYDNNNNTDYAIKQLTSGRTAINSATGLPVDININNVTQVAVTSGKVSVSGYVEQHGIYAGIYVAAASASQLIPAGAGYTKSTAFTTNNESSNCTADAANDKITITKSGTYRVSGSCCAISGTANVIWQAVAFLNGVEQPQAHMMRKFATNTDSGCMSFDGFIDVTSVPWDLDLRLRHDNGAGVNFTIEYANLNVEYVGTT